MTDHKITLTHLNIRQSIAILVVKLVVVDIILSIIVVGIYFLIIQGEQFIQGASRSPVVFLILFGTIGFIKIFITVFIVLQWLTEYYEITPEAIVHKRGILSKKTESYALNKVRAMTIQDTFIGEMCNFATLTLYDVRLNKYLDMYLIHNPARYAKVLKLLRPNLEIKTNQFVIPGISKSELVEENED